MKVLFVLLLIVMSCSKSVDVPHPMEDITTVLEQLKDNIDVSRDSFPMCQYTTTFKGISKDTCTAEGTGSGDADAILFAGMLCLSGETLGCETVRASIDVDGQPHRSPGRLSEEDFSRDMFIGFMSYLVSTKDVQAAKRFQVWFERNDRALCLDSCDMRLTTWGIMGEVWEYLGLPITLDMRQGMLTDDIGQRISSTINDVGFQQHLIITTALIRIRIGTYTESLRSSITTIWQQDTENPLYSYLHEGKTLRTAQLTLEHCPSTSIISASEWQWERHSRVNVDKRMGWDCLFMCNLLN